VSPNRGAYRAENAKGQRVRASFGACVTLGALVATACAPAVSSADRTPATQPRVDDETLVAEFGRIEDDAMGWLAAADPRLASRENATAPDDILKRIGTEAVLAEDATAVIRGNSLDLFAFRARARVLDQAAQRVGAFTARLPDLASSTGAPAHPRLERELLIRLIEEERSRVLEEAKLSDASGDLVRAIVETWTPPATPQDWPDRDAWISKHLLEMRDSLRQGPPRTGPLDLDVSLYPLERLLAPLEYPRGSAAIAELRVALDADMRSVPSLVVPERIARDAKTHLGIAVDSAALPTRIERVEARLRNLATKALAESGAARATVEARARKLLFAEGPCPTVPGSRVRSMGPPPERAAICGALRALAEEVPPGAALVALHDDLLFADAALTTAPPPRTGLLSHPENDVVDALRRTARERPILVIGVALAAELLYGQDGPDDRLRAWSALGEAPLDVVAREINGAL
jgi:hypothetical protein